MSGNGYDRRLVPGARNAVQVCLDVHPDQRVFILTDRRTLTVGRALEDAVEEVGAPCQLEIVEDHVPRPADRLPATIMEPLAKSDVVLYCVYPQRGELPSRAQVVYCIEDHKIKYAHMVGITEDIMCQGMRADFRKVDDVSRRLLERARQCSTISVKSRAGTDLLARFDKDLYTWRKTSGIIEEVWSNLPGGEIFTYPMSVDGVFVVDGTVGDHFGEKYGVLDASPMTLEIENSILRSVRCENRELEREFWEYCHKLEGSDRVGEFAIGTNLAVFEFTGNLLQDEKMPGVHIAFGDPYGSQTGADWSCLTHVDVITRSCDIWIDQEQVMQHGIFVSDKLGIDYTYLEDDPSIGPQYDSEPDWKRTATAP